MPRQLGNAVAFLPGWLGTYLGQVGVIFYDNYSVQVTNGTTDTVFSEFVVFYKRLGRAGVVFLHEIDVQPGETRNFDLGDCLFMESYVVGFFVDDNLVAQLPPEGQGDMTPALASLYKPADQDRCVDAWAITD